MTQKEIEEYESKCVLPVYYKHEQWFCMEAIRINLLKYLKSLNFEYKIKIYNKRTHSILFVSIKDIIV